MIRRLIAMNVMWGGLLMAVSGDLFDTAFDRAENNCRACYQSGYDISVRVEGGEGGHESFGVDRRRARRWAIAQGGCGVTVYLRPRAEGQMGIGSATECQ